MTDFGQTTRVNSCEQVQKRPEDTSFNSDLTVVLAFERDVRPIRSSVFAFVLSRGLWSRTAPAGRVQQLPLHRGY